MVLLGLGAAVLVASGTDSDGQSPRIAMILTTLWAAIWLSRRALVFAVLSLWILPNLPRLHFNGPEPSVGSLDLRELVGLALAAFVVRLKSRVEHEADEVDSGRYDLSRPIKTGATGIGQIGPQRTQRACDSEKVSRDTGRVKTPLFELSPAEPRLINLALGPLPQGASTSQLLLNLLADIDETVVLIDHLRRRLVA